MHDDEVAGFDWDDGNLDKCVKHGVTIAEIEEVLRSADLRIRPDQVHSAEEMRVQAFGRSGAGRDVFVVFTRRRREGMLLIRPISERYMHGSEVDGYGKETAGFRERRRG